MTNLDNLGIKAEKRRLLEQFERGLNEGDAAMAQDWPDWVRDIYTKHRLYERGYLFGVLLAEYDRLDEDIS